MRVTSQMTTDMIRYHLQRQTQQLADNQNRIASAKRFIKPSQDHSATEQVLEYRNVLSSIDQFTRNIGQAEIRIELTETTLSTVHDLLTRAKTIASDVNHETVDRLALADEVKNIRQQILDLANTRFNNSYLFSGHRSDTPAFASDGTYQGDSGDYRILIGEHETATFNADGEDIFTGVEDIFDVLNTLQTGLETDDPAMITAQVGRLFDASEHIRQVRTEHAAAHSLIDTARNHWEEFGAKIETFVEDAERVDMAAAVVELQSRQTAYEANLAVAAQLNRTSLLDFLR
jgi:flagellar hook-associated protein 3 FlgL